MKILEVLAALPPRWEEVALTKQEVQEARDIYMPFIKTLYMFVKEFDAGKMPSELVHYLKSAEANNGVKFLTRYKFSRAAIDNYYKIINDYLKYKGDFDKVEDPIEDLAVEIRDRIGAIGADQAIPHPVLSLLKDWSLHYRTGSDSAFDRLHGNVHVLNDPWLNGLFTADKVEKSAGARDRVKAIVKKMTGKPASDLSKEDRTKFTKSKPALYKEFLAARRDLIKLGKARLAQIIRSKGKLLMDAQKAKEILNNEGYIDTVPEGFVGQVDAQGALYTRTGLKILGGSGGATSVQMNPKYNADEDNAYVFSAISPVTGAKLNVYTESYRKTKNVQKFQKAAVFADQVEALRTKWGQALLKDGSKNQASALILEIAYQTQGRIGNLGNQTDGQNTFGLSTLLCKHAHMPSTTKVRLMYQGKGGIRQKHLMTGVDKISKKAILLLKEFIETGSPTDPLVRYRERRVNSQTVNQYLKSLGSPVTIHKVRTMKGTLMAREILAKSPFEKKPGSAPERKVTDWLKKQLTAVGAQLGHMSGEKVTPTTAIRHYIDPAEIQLFYDRAGVRPPPAIEKILRNNQEH